MSCCASGKELFIEIHQTCITDFLKDFNGCIKVTAKQNDFYIVEAFIMERIEKPISEKES